MTVTRDGDSITTEGNFCKRGEGFAIQELTAPMRTICSTVKTSFRDMPVLPCRVSAEIPKDRMFDVMKEINKVTVTTRLRRGDLILSNVLGLNVDVIATTDL